jgi:hypothetical protein
MIRTVKQSIGFFTLSRQVFYHLSLGGVVEVTIDPEVDPQH